MRDPFLWLLNREDLKELQASRPRALLKETPQGLTLAEYVSAPTNLFIIPLASFLEMDEYDSESLCEQRLSGRRDPIASNRFSDRT